MRLNKNLKTLRSLLKRPMFTSNEAKKLGVSSALLCYYVKIGKLRRLKRGVYQSIDYYNPEVFRWTDLVQSSYSISNGTVCLISALAIYEITEEIPRQHWIAIPHYTSIKVSEEIKIVRLRNPNLGRTKMQLEETTVFIYDIERTIIDAFRLLSIETAIKALKKAYVKKELQLNLQKLETYAKKLRFNIKPYLIGITCD